MLEKILLKSIQLGCPEIGRSLHVTLLDNQNTSAQLNHHVLVVTSLATISNQNLLQPTSSAEVSPPNSTVVNIASRRVAF